jgi:hypothetical protein
VKIQTGSRSIGEIKSRTVYAAGLKQSGTNKQLQPSQPNPEIFHDQDFFQDFLEIKIKVIFRIRNQDCWMLLLLVPVERGALEKKLH